MVFGCPIAMLAGFEACFTVQPGGGAVRAPGRCVVDVLGNFLIMLSVLFFYGVDFFLFPPPF